MSRILMISEDFFVQIFFFLDFDFQIVCCHWHECLYYFLDYRCNELGKKKI